MKKRGKKTKIQNEREEAKSLKKIFLKDIGSGQATQLCLEAYKVPDVLEILKGANLNIESCLFGYRYREMSAKVETPKKISEIASVYHRKGGSDETIDVSMSQVSVAEAKENLDKICDYYKLNPSEFNVRRIRLTNKDGVILVFKLVLKGLPMNQDKRTKVRVLAWMKVNRDPMLEKKANQIVSKFTMAKYLCKFHLEEKKVAICSKVE